MANVFESISTWATGLADWVQEHLGDKELAAALREDLGLKAGSEQPKKPPEGTPAIDKYLAALDPDKQAFADMVAEIVDTVMLVKDFADTIAADGLSGWDVLYLLGKVAAADSLRVRAPAIYAIARLLEFISDDPDTVAELDPARLVGIVTGNPPPPGSGEAIAQRISSGIGLLIMIAEAIVDHLADDGVVDALYGWDPEPGSTSPTSDLIAQRTATVVVRLAGEEGAPGAKLGVTLIAVPPEHGGPGVFVSFTGAATLAGDLGDAHVALEFGAANAFSLFIPFGGATRSLQAAGEPSGFVSFDVTPKPDPEKPALRFGVPKGTRLDIGSFGLGVEIGTDRAGVRLALVKGLVVISLADGDGFISKLPGGRIEVPFDLGLTVDTEHGLRFDGGTSARVNLPVGATVFGVFTIQYLELAIGPSPSGSVGIELAGAFSLKLGPFRASVDRIGMSIDPGAAANNPEGLADLIAFKPPNGIGLALDAGVVKGGGYLFIDHARHEYAGALELAITLPVAGTISIKAVGFLSTRRPDGKEGWSLFLLLYSQFRVQLSWGFTLNGVGGMLGLHHGVDNLALSEGMRSGVLDDILFPDDPVGDAPRIVNRLRTVFPMERNTLTVGPALQIGWGTPTIVDIKLGLLFELDNALGGGRISLSKVTLLGQLLVQIPPKSTRVPPVIKLLVDVVGWYDFDEQWLFFRVGLRDSFIGVGGGSSPLKLNLNGELLASMRFGDNPSFVLSAGGFHPRFKDLPKGVPADLKRLGISLDIGVLKLTVESYFALTSNSVQTGLSIEIRADLGPVDIKGWLGFDALFVFEPTFHFIVEIRFGVSLRFKGFNLCGISVKLSLEGPGRWHAVGSATFSILFWDVDVGFDESWGSTPPVDAGTVDAAAALNAAVEDPASWSAQLPAASASLVTLQPAKSEIGLVAHPLGRLEFVQRVLPFGLDLVRIGERRIEGANRFELTSFTVGDHKVASPKVLTEHFARAQFVDRTDEEKLTDESFERFPAGAVLGSDDYTVPAAVGAATLEYEERYLEPDEIDWKIIDRGLGVRLTIDHEAIRRQSAWGGAGLSPRKRIEQLKGDGAKVVVVGEPGLALAGVVDVAPLTVGLSEFATASPSLARQESAAFAASMVVESYELSGVL